MTTNSRSIQLEITFKKTEDGRVKGGGRGWGAMVKIDFPREFKRSLPQVL